LKPEVPKQELPDPGRPPGNRSGVALESKIENPKSKIARFLAYRRLWALALVVFVLDQFTKELIIARLPFGTWSGGGYEVIPGFFHLIHVGNTGGAWSIFSGRSLPLALVGLVVLAAVYVWRHQLGLRHHFAQWCFGLFVGGSVGNIVDRLRHGHVVDFLDFRFGDYVYPTFNVADSGICVGVIAYVIWSLKQPAPPEPGAE
jgi:signal peptidase II